MWVHRTGRFWRKRCFSILGQALGSPLSPSGCWGLSWLQALGDLSLGCSCYTAIVVDIYYLRASPVAEQPPGGGWSIS